MTIRRASPADIPSVMQVAASADTAAQWSRADYERWFDARGPSRLALVAEDTEGILGFIVALCAGPEWEIENIVVAATARRRGVGAQLLDELLKEAQMAGAESVYLEVRESNRAARELYERAGFQAMGTRPDYYSSPAENAVIYQVVLTNRENADESR
ncbi:MAG: ribosomal protein S18-alanine N-acetyltransferase [Terriglobales bacterium]